MGPADKLARTFTADAFLSGRVLGTKLKHWLFVAGILGLSSLSSLVMGVCLGAAGVGSFMLLKRYIQFLVRSVRTALY